MLLEDWTPTKLSRLIKIKHGFAFKGELITDVPNDRILLTPGNFRIGGGFKDDKLRYYTGEYPAEYALEEGDLLISMTDLSKLGDTLGFPLLVPKTEKGVFLHNQRLGKVTIRDNAPLLKEYLFYVLCSQDYRNEVLSSATGTTVKHTSPSRIMDYEFNLPPVEEQRTIADVLRNFDAKIELNDKITETIESIGSAIFKQWFIDFEFPNAEGEPYKSSAGKMIQVGPKWIPYGWKLTKIGELATITSGKRPVDISSKLTTEYKTPVYGGAGIIGYVRDSLFESEILVTGRVGTLGVIMRVQHPSYPSDNTLVLASKKKEYYEYLHLLLKNLHLGNLNRGSTQPLITQKDVARTTVLLPPERHLRQFHRLTSKLFSKVDCNNLESATLQKLRDIALPKLIRGQLDSQNKETQMQLKTLAGAR